MIPAVTSSVPCVVTPGWALLERRLLEIWNSVPDIVTTRYLRENGEMLWPTVPDFCGIDALDDTYESFNTWPLAYLLGASEEFLTRAQRQFEAITTQFARYDTGFGRPMVVNEYEQGYDWFHQGEGYLLFYYLCLADPQHRANVQRARRFGGIWLNDGVPQPNYDAAKRIIRAPFAGSYGPGFDTFGHTLPPALDDWLKGSAGTGLPFQGVPGVRSPDALADPAVSARYIEVIRERMGRGDTVVNLAATSMVTNAYIATGDGRFRQWVLDYIEGWIDRWEANGRIIPDNVGLSGKVGEYLDGKWYGGWYGWTFPSGWHSVGAAVTIAVQNALLLTGDAGCLELLRSQLDALTDRAIEQDGTLFLPRKRGDAGWYGYSVRRPSVLRDDRGDVLWRDGWFEFAPADALYPAHLWAASQSPEDLLRLERLRNFVSRDHEQVSMAAPGPAKDLGGHDQAWVAFLKGEFPGYAERILEYSLAVANARLQFIADDDQDPSTYGDFYLQRRNPIAPESLVQLTMGAPRAVFYGGLLHVRLRYFDADRLRPGLPPDVAALVTGIRDDATDVTLVNLSPTEHRRLVVQGGAFGEHELTSVRYSVRPAGQRFGHSPSLTTPQWDEATMDIGGQWLTVHMRPHSQITLTIGMRRHARTPSYDLPWPAG